MVLVLNIEPALHTGYAFFLFLYFFFSKVRKMENK